MYFLHVSYLAEYPLESIMIDIDTLNMLSRLSDRSFLPLENATSCSLVVGMCPDLFVKSSVVSHQEVYK